MGGGYLKTEPELELGLQSGILEFLDKQKENK